MSRVGAVILARMDSSRLPGKVLGDLGGRPLLWWLVQRLRAAGGLDQIILATTDRAVDDGLAEWGRSQGLPVYRGPAEDVLGRMYGAARRHHLDYIVRANGDSPLLCPRVTTAALQQLRGQRLDLVTGKRAYTGLPAGVGPEVVTWELLQRLHVTAEAPEDREHVTSYVFAHPDAFRWAGVEVPSTWRQPDLAMTVDDEGDQQYMDRVIRRLRHHGGPPASWTVGDLIAAGAWARGAGREPVTGGVAR